MATALRDATILRCSPVPLIGKTSFGLYLGLFVGGGLYPCGARLRAVIHDA